MSDFEPGAGATHVDEFESPEAAGLRARLKEMVLAPSSDEEEVDEWDGQEQEVQYASSQVRRFIRDNPNREGHEVIPPPVLEAIARIAKTWRVTNKRYLEIFHDQNSVDDWYFEEELWDARSMEMTDHMAPLLDPKNALRFRNISSGEAMPEIEDAELASSLLGDPNFTEKAAVVDYVAFDLWQAFRRRKMSSTVSSDKEKDAEYEKVRARDLPLIQQGIITLLESGDVASIREVLENIEYVGESAFATNILFDAQLSSDQRQAYMIQHINVFGFIETVDVLSHKIAELALEDTEEATQLTAQLKKLFTLIQGEQVDEVLHELEEVYDAVDFERYALNHEQLTVREVDKLEAIARSLAETTGKDSHDVRVIDIGAGVGRHAIGLRDRGFRYISALESQPQHVEILRSKAPEVRIIGNNWHDIPLASGDAYDEAPELFYCLGRTVPHNRTPQDMLKLFDEIQRITAPNAKGLIDIPDITIGEYQERVQKFGDNLAALPGIDPHESRLVFDGPDNVHKFNRMVLTPQQMEIYARMCGFKIQLVGTEEVEAASGVNNQYYLLEKDEGFYPDDISREELSKMIKDVGLYDAGVDYQMYVDAWGMTLGQAIWGGLDNDEVRMRNSVGRGPVVSVEKRGRALYFEGIL